MANAKPIVKLVAETNDYEKKMRQANKTFNDFMKGIGMSTSKFTALSLGIGATTTALKVAKDAFRQSESNIDEWGRTMEGAKSAYNLFLDTLNNGNWSNFFKNLETAIRGGRDLYDVFDRLGSIKSNNAAAIAMTQKEIAELRLAKQQGENVDAKLKAATARLSTLQRQGIDAGINAGNQSAFQTIRNGVNSIGGARVNDATIKYAVQQIMKNGQTEFDKYRRNYDILRRQGTVERPKFVPNTSGGSTLSTESVFDINRLTREQQRQYAIAKAITEGETRIQQGISAYAQAVSEGTASAREAFKGNRYALQGSGGGGKGGGGASSGGNVFAAGSIDAQAAKVQALQKAWRAAADDDSREKYRKQIEEAEFALDILMGKTSGLPTMNYGIGDLAGSKGGNVGAIFSATAPKKSEWKLDDKSMRAVAEHIAKMNEKGDSNVLKNVSDIAGGVQGVLNGIESLGIEVPAELQGVIGGIQSMIGILSSITAIVSGIQAMQQVGTWLGLIPHARGGLVRAAGGFLIPGNFPSGDNLRMPINGGGMAALNSGELILNTAQQNAVASQLSGAASMSDFVLVSEIAGEDIRIALRRNSVRRRKGEYVTTKRG